jgi:CheY-like chemotaxis protein
MVMERKKILVVDDEQNIRSLLKRMLEKRLVILNQVEVKQLSRDSAKELLSIS